MSLMDDFKKFCEEISLSNYSDMQTSVGEIAKKLNKRYYEADSDSESHIYIVGSVGRKTAINKTSDLDVIFDLPNDVFTRFNSYADHGQSKLLQEVKDVLKERYSRTDIRGDGQVVVIDFSSYTVELVPSFKQTDGRFKYPDTNEGGSWKFTDPLAEQREAKNTEVKSFYNFFNFCKMVRIWKKCSGAVMGGLLIDTLCYQCFGDNDNYFLKGYSDYYEILVELFKYFKELNKDQVYWNALGSNQQVVNQDGGSFIDCAKDTYDILNEAESEDDKYSALKNVFGSTFATDYIPKSDSARQEEFIDQKFAVDLKFKLKIDCTVSQKGFRTFNLREALRQPYYKLKHDKTLTFTITSCDVPIPYNIYWKIRNVGDEASRREMIRGKIFRNNTGTQVEHSIFKGPHYVECYIVKNDICVARDRINVPIDLY